MTQFRFSAHVDSEDLHELIIAVATAATRRRFDPKIELDLILSAFPEEPVQKKKPYGDWPKPGSIYATVLEAIAGGPRTAPELRNALEAGGFKSGSLSSALDRLAKAGKAHKQDDGWHLMNA